MTRYITLYRHPLDQDTCHLLELIICIHYFVFIPTIALRVRPYVSLNIYEISIHLFCFELRLTINERDLPF